MSRDAWLVLADGAVYRGEAFGADAEGEGEVVFHTGMTGYQEILTDPSYAGQIVCMTYPEIGNTGTNPQDEESAGVHLQGFAVRSHNDFPSNWRCKQTLHEYLQEREITGISGIDTRALVRRIRTAGAINGVLVHGAHDPGELRERAARIPSMEGRNLVDEVSCSAAYDWRDAGEWNSSEAPPERRYRVVAYDFGIKRNILRELVRVGLDVRVVPARTTAAEALAGDPDGIFLSNGPGDPAAVDYAISTVRELLGRRPLFGICLGHQILALALGARTRKLRFGHHGANQPALDAATRRVAIASENHGFAIDPASLARDPEIEITHTNLNDGTPEGLRHKRLPLFSVQYHPEASPGPHDATELFTRFRSLIESFRA